MDELLAAAEKHLEEDRKRAQIIQRAQRFAKALEADTDPACAARAKELIEIVGEEQEQ